MKNVMNFFIVVFICVSVSFLVSCSKDTPVNSKGAVKFSIGLSTSLKSLTLSDTSGINDSTSSYYAVVTITDNSGQPVYNSKKLSIYKFGEEYVSESLSLEVGTYKLTEFFIISGSNVVYATPVTGSDRAQLVNDPLPLVFSVTGNNSTLIKPEVLLTSNVSPQEFGYSSFSFSIIETTSFKIITYDSTSTDTASAIQSSLQIRITNYSDSTRGDTMNLGYKILNYALIPSINTIEVNNAASYTLTIYKSGYMGWSGNYTLGELNNYKSNPLRIFLKQTVPLDSIKLNH